jgi:fumigaclavine B O-acetyltransferase
VLRFQANFLADGLVLCMGYSHSVFDGTGAGNILELLADCCRADPASIIFLSTTGDIESELRGLLSDPGVAVANPSQAAYAIHCAHTEVEPGSFPGMLCSSPFLLSSEKIECLREACNSLLPHLVRTYRGAQSSVIRPDPKWPQILSSNDVLTALLAVSVEKARETIGPRKNGSRSLAMAVDLRERLKPMPKHYLGNFVTTVWASHHQPVDKDPETMILRVLACNRPEIDRDDLLWIAHVAFRIRLGLNAINEEHIRGLVHYLQSQDNWEKIGIHFTDPIFISSWRHLKVYELDFGPGIGHVENFEMDVGTTDGVCVVMPANERAVGKTKKAPWDIRIVLNSEVMEALVTDTLFGWAMVKDASE